MKEELISFNTAKLAKEKGFNINTYSYYNFRKELNENFSIINQYENYYIEDKGNFLLIPYNDNYNYIYLEKIDFNDWKDSYSAPTQSLLQKWIREKYFIHIEVHSRHSSWVFYIFNLSNWNRECLLNIDWYGSNDYLISKNIPTILKTYEEALEVGLQEALKLIEI